MSDPLLSVQLYSLRRETAANAEETIRQAPELGYDGIELAGDYGWPVEKWRQLLDETGLRVVGAHVGLEALESGFDARAAFHRALDASRLIVPAVEGPMRNTAGYHSAARRLNDLGAECAAAGFSLLYHNHDFEFARLEESGGCGMDILLAETDPALVRFEFDTYWLERAGRDSLRFFEDHMLRTGMVHAKELRKRDNADVPAGQGDVDFKAILPMARENGWPIVVEYEGDGALESVRQSAKYLRGLLARP